MALKQQSSSSSSYGDPSLPSQPVEKDQSTVSETTALQRYRREVVESDEVNESDKRDSLYVLDIWLQGGAEEAANAEEYAKKADEEKNDEQMRREVGCAGVAHSAFQLRKLIYARFDKIHRIMNDLKGAEMDATVRGCFRKANLWSSYLYGLNNRPFGTGAHFTLKKEYLCSLPPKLSIRPASRNMSPASLQHGTCRVIHARSSKQSLMKSS